MTVMVSWLKHSAIIYSRLSSATQRENVTFVVVFSIILCHQNYVKSDQRSWDFRAFQSTSVPSQALVMNFHDQIFEAGLPEYDCTVNTTLSLSCYQHCQLFSSEESVRVSGANVIIHFVLDKISLLVLITFYRLS